MKREIKKVKYERYLTGDTHVHIRIHAGGCYRQLPERVHPAHSRGREHRYRSITLPQMRREAEMV